MNVFDDMINMQSTDYAEIVFRLENNLDILNALQIAHANGRVEAMREVARFAGAKLQDAQAQRHCVLSMAIRIQDDDSP